MALKWMAKGLTWIVALAVFLLAPQVSAEETPVLKTRNDKMSYGFGVDVGRNLKRQGIEVDVDTMAKGFLTPPLSHQGRGEKIVE